jgi:hypothetical protein
MKVKTLKYTIPQLIRYFGFPQDFRLEDAPYISPRGKEVLPSFGQSWQRLGRSHVPLQVYAIAATLRQHVLNRLEK